MFKINNRLLFFIILLSIFSELLLYIFIKNGYFQFKLGGGNDAEYYHEYALGYIEFATSSWPIFLRYLNELNLYSREVISYIFLFFQLFIIPYLITKLSNTKFHGNQRNFFLIYLLCILYPTLYFYSLDIYRDVFMVVSFLIGCVFVRKTVLANNYLHFLLFLLISISIGFFLVGLRPYLGLAFLLSLLFWKIKLAKKKLIIVFLLYLFTLFIVNYLGYLDGLKDYRSSFEEMGGGTTIGLDFSNPVKFIPNFILSALGQLFGLYITNFLAMVLFLVETLPFLVMLKYVIRNIRIADGFVRFLLVFFVIYASVWLIGNDNLGTAVRLRMYNYFAIYISFFYILNLKKQQGIK